MKIRSISYYINEAFISLVRNRLMAVASIITVASCILTVSLSYCIAVNLGEMLSQIENSIGLSAYLDYELTSGDIKSLYDKIEMMEEVESVEYISPEEALESFKANLGDSDEILIGLEKDNPLPRSFAIELYNSKDQPIVIKKLEALEPEGIFEVRHKEEIVSALAKINYVVRIISINIIAVLLITSIIIIINTIRLTVDNRKLEINIMKYVGATDTFIRWPFILEGILIGFIGSCIPVIICWLSYPKAVEVIYKNLMFLEDTVVFKSALSVFIVLAPIALAIGVLIGVIGSVTSIRRHLRV